ncbi:TolC family protein [Nemorincola caseinilytica]|uniref:TolC family protein n=2 Tax=Nemorincola caseinilytica TaxID=2054315 RepID=A0ABP8NFV0_9BACT
MADTAATPAVAGLSPHTFFRDKKLQTIIRDVLQHNPDMNIALQHVRIADATLLASRGALLPSLQANAGASGTRYGKYTMEGVGNYDTNLSPNIEDAQVIGTRPTPNYLLGFSSSWEVDIWGKLSNMKHAARMRYLASQEGVSWVKSMLIARTATLYYDLIALDKEAEIIDKNIRLQERALEIVTIQKAGGRATELAVQQFKAQLLNTRSAEYAIKQRILETENELSALAGKYTMKIERSPDLEPGHHFDERMGTGTPVAMLAMRPDVRQAHAELEATKADANAARAAFFPSLTISAYAAYNAFSGNMLFAASSLGYQLFGGLTAPIFQRHQLRAQFAIANAKQQEAFYAYEKATLNAYREVLNDMNMIENTRQMQLLKEEEVASLSLGIDISNDLYTTGYASYLEIVTAQKSKLDAELQLVNIRRDRIHSNIELYRALGGGWQ